MQAARGLRNPWRCSRSWVSLEVKSEEVGNGVEAGGFWCYGRWCWILIFFNIYFDFELIQTRKDYFINFWSMWKSMSL